ncbi:MAG: hypothetical protein J6L92_01315, partial [Clostridia bacterium]|nr:hypothetical protein [Clostridia bacterium]
DQGLAGVGIASINVTRKTEGNHEYIVFTFTMTDSSVVTQKVLLPTTTKVTVENINVAPGNNDTFVIDTSNSSENSVTVESQSQTVSAQLPNGVVISADKVESSTTSLTLNVEQLGSEEAESGNVTIETGDSSNVYVFNINIPEVDESNNIPITITLKGEVEKNLTGVIMFHDGVQMTAVASASEVDAHNEFYYDPATGDITLATASFSNFTIIHSAEKLGIAVSTAAELQTLLANATSALVIDLKNDITISNKLAITVDTVINGNGHTLTYSGADRAIDVSSTSPDVDLEINDLTIDCTASWCERGVSYNAKSTLTLNKVEILGNINYGINLPGSSIGVQVNLTECVAETSYIAVNVWGENSVINITDCIFYTECESDTAGGVGATISLNLDTTASASGTTINITGGRIAAAYTNETTASPRAIKNSVDRAEINIDGTAEIIGIVFDERSVAKIDFDTSVEGDSFLSFISLQDAVDWFIENDNDATIVLLDDITIDTLDVSDAIVLDLSGFTVDITGEITGEENITILGTGTFNGTAYN